MYYEISNSSYVVEPYHILSYGCRKLNGESPILRIGKYCSIAHNCTFVMAHHLMDRITTAPTQDHLFDHKQGNTHGYSKGDIIIKDDVWIGANVTLMDNITIGQGAVISSGSIVIKDVEPYSIVGGNPAKHLKYRFTESVIKELLELNIYDIPDDKLKEFNLWTDDIQGFIKKVKDYYGR
jgi:virginiamycin A acetyltransferase